MEVKGGDHALLIHYASLKPRETAAKTETKREINLRKNNRFEPGTSRV